MTATTSPTGWGDPARRTGLPPHATAWLVDALGPAAATPPSGPPALRASAADHADLQALRDCVGVENVLVDDDSRLLRAAGRSYLDLLALRTSAELAGPDAVVLPGSAEQVAAVLRVCAERKIAVVPYGGGTSVVGGVTPLRGQFDTVITLDLRRLDRLLSVDTESLTAVFEPGVRGPAAESLLAAYGLTLGHFPQSYEQASLGGYAATRSAGQASTGYGRFDELVVALELQTPTGPLVLGRGAASAAGPDLMALALGSEGAFGVLTSVTVQVRRVPETRRYEGVFFRTWEQGCAALREMEQEGLAPDVARLSDPDETRVQLALAGTGGIKGRLGRAVLRARGYRGGCLAILGWEGTPAGVAARREASMSVCRSHSAFAVGSSVGERWEHGRYDGPYLREDLLDDGVLVETLETSATWSRLAGTREAIRRALLETLPGAVVMVHVSHLYRHGASLYITVLARRSGDPVGQWQRAKDAACAAIVASGATITHHHAVGTDHRDWMSAEVGPLGIEVLRAVKATLDPVGVMNPHKLIPVSSSEPEA
ncbi:MAG: FAD-binding oxidoreductase [Frankiales bacterium]|nr:FAD-binding oxidoreductase [Frankiales bacterium]